MRDYGGVAGCKLGPRPPGAIARLYYSTTRYALKRNSHLKLIKSVRSFTYYQRPDGHVDLDQRTLDKTA